jgi:hypothetical protein
VSWLSGLETKALPFDQRLVMCHRSHPSLTASVSRSLDLTESDWGLRKKTQRQTYRKAWDQVGPALLMKDADGPLHLQKHLFIQQVWESRVKFRSSSHGSSCVGSRNSTAVACCYLLQTTLTLSTYPVFPARQPC